MSTAGTTPFRIDDLPTGARFLLNERWYEWRKIEASDIRHLAYFLSPNSPMGEPTNTGHTIASGTVVEAVDSRDLKLSLYKKLQRGPFSAMGESNSEYDS